MERQVHLQRACLDHLRAEQPVGEATKSRLAQKPKAAANPLHASFWAGAKLQHLFGGLEPGPD